MDIKFHCDSKNNFKNEQELIRAFIYTDYSIDPHNHDFYEMNIVLRGKGKHQIENACFDVTVGDVFIIPPMTVHAYFDTKNLDVYHILLQKSFIANNRSESQNVPGFIQLVEIEPFLRQHFSSEMFLHLTQSQIMQLKSDLSLIDDSVTLGKDSLKPLKNHTVWKILYWFSGLLFSQMSKESKSLTKYELEIIRILEYIHQNYEKKITIDLLCKESFLSRSTFLRSFGSVCGCTPMEYVTGYRCQKAVVMMENGNFSKTEIAHSCGFYDLSHMEKTLKQLYKK